ncbi:unnamed protein product [Microthlaspi erraticum]|uniref:Uncharacterized protein n=1 Tax=Microthlaspi erraticum TaxID=1685480 RepID=A0A6D2JA14_9BRAS|nr:unnamed protein product [Microthlaspi erraticum]
MKHFGLIGTAYKTPIGRSPFNLLYGKDCHLPVEVEYKALWAVKMLNFDIKAAQERRLSLAGKGFRKKRQPTRGTTRSSPIKLDRARTRSSGVPLTAVCPLHDHDLASQIFGGH